MFKGQTALLATIHQKELAIAPVLKDKLGLLVIPVSDLNTDTFGTFSGEVARTGSQYQSALAKIEAAEKLNPQQHLFLASEGSFYPHPDAPFITLNSELILFIDRKNKLEIQAWNHTVNTNYRSISIGAYNKLKEFAEQLGFPNQGIILKLMQDDVLLRAIKDIATWPDLLFAYNSLTHNTSATVVAEADMRAHKNPTRMESIKLCADKLASLLLSTCPSCQTPGFTIVDTKPGLPCSCCGFPTRSAMYSVCTCSTCGYSITKKYPNGKQTEDPVYCDNCNP